MKKIILGIVLLMLASAAFSQQNNPLPDLTKQDYGRKSKHQKTAALIFLGAGTGLITTAFIIEPFYNYKRLAVLLWRHLLIIRTILYFSSQGWLL